MYDDDVIIPDEDLDFGDIDELDEFGDALLKKKDDDDLEDVPEDEEF